MEFALEAVNNNRIQNLKTEFKTGFKTGLD